MPPSSSAIAALQKRIWTGALPLEIRLATAECRSYDQADPYLINVPRVSYLPFILSRLHAFFACSLIDSSVSHHEAWLSFEEVPLKWHYPVGLLYDLFSGFQPASNDQTEPETDDNQTRVLPWQLTVHYTAFPTDQLFPLDAEGKVLLDAFINSVKEADYIRNGTAKTVMSLSKGDSDSLWHSVQSHNLSTFNIVNNKLLNPPGSALRHIPIKVYLPTTSAPSTLPTTESTSDLPHRGSIRVVQGLVAPFSSTRQVITLGSALNSLLPSVFPSRRNPVLATPVLHGAIVPMSASMEDLGRAASYADGFLHVAVVLLR